MKIEMGVVREKRCLSGRLVSRRSRGGVAALVLREACRHQLGCMEE